MKLHSATKPSGFRIRSSGGFSMGELLIAIVVLGILASVAMPKFVDLKADARAASLESARSAITTAANLVYLKAQLQGKASGDAVVNMDDGSQVTVNFGYPGPDSILSAAALNGYFVQSFGMMGLWMSPKSNDLSNQCYLYYDLSFKVITGKGLTVGAYEPVVSVVTNGC